jgi:pimeloyl-ACP methyl ester carboxylesterase
LSRIYKSAAGEQAVRARYLELLDGWPVPSEHIRVPTRHGETFVVASGPHDAPPVVLLQGSGANTAMWIPEATVWSEHFRLHAVDLIGEPGLSAPERPPLTSGAYAQWLDDVLDGLGIARAALVGVSLGGWLALDYVGHRGERISGLALLSPSGIGRQRTSFVFKALPLALLGSRGRRRMFELVAGPPRPGDDGMLGEFASLVSQHFRPRLERVPLVSDEVLGRLAMPGLVVVGGRDVMLDSYDTRARLERLAPQVTVRLLPEGRHVLPSQAAAVVEFLRTSSDDAPGGAG